MAELPPEVYDSKQAGLRPQNETNRERRTIPEIFIESSQTFAERPALIYRRGHCFEFVPYKRLLNLVQNFTLSLEKAGVKKKDRVVLVSENRPEWPVTDLAVQSLGAVLVPIHKVLSAEQMGAIVSETEPTLFIVSDSESFIKISETKNSFKRNIPIICLNYDVKEEKNLSKDIDAYTFIETLQFVPHHESDIDVPYKDRIKGLDPEDPVTIIYTAGTTGRFRGVELNHTNLISNVEDTRNIVKVHPEDKFLSILPLSHVFERAVGYYVPLFSGSAISYAEDVSKVAYIVKQEKPTIIVGVPRLYEKVYEKVQEAANKSLLRKKIFNLALSYGKNNKNRTKLLHKIFDHLVYKKVRDSLGGNIRFLVSGAAALNPKIGEFFDAAGLPVLEGYGLTETSPILTCNRLENYRYGTVGLPLPRTEIKIADDGEILARGPGVMQRYYKNGEANREAFVNGWFKTGDLGEMDANGFLKIKGRKKEIIVLSTGENVSPELVEERLEANEYISQSFVFGDGEKHIGALIVPNFENLREVFCEKTQDELIKDIEVKDFIQREICKQSENLAAYERAKKFILIDEPFTVENGLMTLSLKLRRHKIFAKYKEHIEALYAANASARLGFFN